MKHFNFIIRFLESQRNLLYLFLFVLIIPNVILSFTEPMNWAGKICNTLLPFAVYYWLMCKSKNLGKAFLYLFPFVFLAAFQIVLLYLFKRSIIAVDMFLNLVTTNPTEAMELLDNLLPAIVIVVILYIPTLAAAIYTAVKKQNLTDAFKTRHLPKANKMCLAGVASLIAAFITGHHYEIKSDLYPANVCYNIYQAAQRTKWTAEYDETSKNFTYHAHSTHPKEKKEIYIMVVGETSRACNWELMGYERPTNPELKGKEGLAFFPYTLSESNTTHKSVPMLISSVSAVNFDSIYYRKGIITAFREAGFHTSFISNQRRNHSFIDLFGTEADEYNFIKEESSDPKYNPSDHELLQHVADILKQGRSKEFIVLHMYGSHFNYHERYPEDKAFFTPDTPVDAEPIFRNSLLNAYDNTIRYTDQFLAQLADMLQTETTDAALIYTSDHGEDIFDDHRKLFLHASPVPSYYQIHVPFLIWASTSYRDSYAELWNTILDNRQKNVASSTSFFHTMLQLAGIDTPYRNDSLSVAAKDFRNRPRVYLTDHNEARPLTEIGMDKEDFELLTLHHIEGWQN